MRRRLGSLRGRSMARRPGEDGPALTISPRATRVAGWVVAVLIIIGIAVAVSVLGGDADEVQPGPSGSAASAGAVAEIAFGTAIDPVTGEVAEDALVDRFAEGDTFAYSARPAEPPPTVIYVEVRRVGGGPAEVVQEASEQSLPEGADVIAFAVPADDLITEFGLGEFLMTISPAPRDEPIAEGMFTLVGPETSPAVSP